MNSFENAAPNPKHRSRPWKIAGALVALAILLLVFRPFHSRAKTEELSPVPIVGAVKIKREPIAREVVFDSEFRPYQEIDLHAKVSGFVASILVDVGDRVKEGQLIATLELPETQNDLDRALASQRRNEAQISQAQAAYEEAHLTYTRLMSVDQAQPHLLAQQDLDTAQAKEKTAEARLTAQREEVNVSIAEIKKLQTMMNYARITAPFSGVITKRYADKGALIQAGTSSSTQSLPLVRLSENEKLRLVFPVSVSFVSQIKMADPVEIHVPSLNRTIAGKITRSTRKVEFATRTMEVEVDLDNPGLELIPGMYASVSMQMDRKASALTVPVEALSRQKNAASVYLINEKGIIEDRPVKLGLEEPATVEVLSGLSENDLVMVGNRSEVKPGEKVTPQIVDLAAAKNSDKR